MSEWFFRKKSKGEVERDHARDEYFTSNRSTDESPRPALISKDLVVQVCTE